MSNAKAHPFFMRFMYHLQKGVSLFALLYVLLSGSVPAQVPLTIGEIHTLASSHLGEDRRLNIYLPPGYDSSGTAYPVIYLLDGSLDEDLVHVVGLTQFFVLQFQMPPAIVVGIANVDRKRDFTFPTTIAEDQAAFPTTGHSAAFRAFLAEELLPYVQAHFRTTDTRYLIGQSLGGLLATEVLLRQPTLFTHYLIVSPSLWWDNQSLLAQAQTLLRQAEARPAYVYVSVGKGEHPIMRRDARRLAKLLQASGKPGMKTDFLLMKAENHATILHRSLYEAFLRLFPYQAAG